MENKIFVICAVIKKNNKVLLAKRKTSDDFGNKWEFPGGEKKQFENKIECLYREIEEELSIKVNICELITSIDFSYKDFEYIIFAYLAEYVSGEIILTEHSEFRWVEKDKLLDFNLARPDIEIAKKIQEQYLS
jgi:8-oxo-dGTP diphosphatase